MFVLNEAGFRRLCRGEPLTVDDPEIRLSTKIGWVKMIRAVLDAISPPAETDPTRPGPPDPPEAREFLPNRRRR
jgi:hypothetical protein